MNTDFNLTGSRDPQQQALNLAEVYVRGTARMLALQVSAMRAVLETQGRSAALLGGPDWSELFDRRTGEQLSTLFETGAEQTVRLLHRANAAALQVQQQFGALIEQQAQQATQQMQRSMEEMGRRSREGLEQLGRMSMRGVDEAARTASAAQYTAEQPVPQQTIITPGAEQSGSSEERARSRRSA
jgi:hypothetical protein